MVTLNWWVPSFLGAQELFDQLAEQFEAEHPNITVDINYLPENGYIDLMNAGLDTGAGLPDVGWWGEPNWHAAAMDLAPFLEADPDVGADLYYPEIWKTRAISGGRVFGLPIGVGANFVMYNKEAFDDAGVDYPTADWTPAEYLEIAAAVANPDIRRWGSDRPRGSFRVLWRAFNAYLYSEDSTTVDGYYNGAGSLAAFTWLWDLVASGATPTPADIEVLGTEGTGPIDLFLSGRLAMATLNNDHMITARNAGIRFGAAPEPHNPEHERFVNAWSQTTSIWEGSDHPAEAWELLKFFGGETGQRFLMENSNLFPSIPGLREDFVAVHATNEDAEQAIGVVFDVLRSRMIAEWDSAHPCWRGAVRRVGDTWDLIMLGEIERAAIAAQLDADVPVLQQTLDDCIPRLGA